MRALRSGVTVASAQPCGARLERAQVCRYHDSPRLPAPRGTGRVSYDLGCAPLAREAWSAHEPPPRGADATLAAAGGRLLHPGSRARNRAFSGHALRRVAPLTTKPPSCGGFRDGRYWARTSDPQLVERAGLRARPLSFLAQPWGLKPRSGQGSPPRVMHGFT